MSDLVKRLRRQLTMSMFATRTDLYGKLNEDRDDAADRIERLESVLVQARDAMNCHAKMYPHMQKGYTVDAMAAIDEALNTGDQR